LEEALPPSYDGKNLSELLLTAVSRRHVYEARKLLAAGADATAHCNGYTVLHRAVMASVSVVADLLTAGADPNSAGRGGMTPLMLSVRVNQHYTKALLSHGADVNAVDEDGWTALMFAAFHSFRGNIVLLLAAGADPTMRNKDGQTAAQIRPKKENASCARILNEAEVGWSGAPSASPVTGKAGVAPDMTCPIADELADTRSFRPLMTVADASAALADDPPQAFIVCTDADTNGFVVCVRDSSGSVAAHPLDWIQAATDVVVTLDQRRFPSVKAALASLGLRHDELLKRKRVEVSIDELRGLIGVLETAGLPEATLDRAAALAFHDADFRHWLVGQGLTPGKSLLSEPVQAVVKKLNTM